MLNCYTKFRNIVHIKKVYWTTYIIHEICCNKKKTILINFCKTWGQQYLLYIIQNLRTTVLAIHYTKSIKWQFVRVSYFHLQIPSRYETMYHLSIFKDHLQWGQNYCESSHTNRANHVWSADAMVPVNVRLLFTHLLQLLQDSSFFWWGNSEYFWGQCTYICQQGYHTVQYVLA